MIWWIGVLFAGGILLILAEFILPGAICGVAGVLMLLGSAYLGTREWPDHTVLVIFGELAATAVCIALGLWFISRTGGFTGLTLKHTERAEEGYVSVETDPALLNARGEAMTVLRPAGTVLIGERRVDAVSSGVFIEKGTPVRVIEVQGGRVVVEPDGMQG